ncbi:PKD/REJ-like domain,EGF-like domain [Cinara cedri]|uniref:PKD/REJ-like domain,EGF-like domain n=1 Tax=Cinara cedri TaxID=506608 RepID=A0A5E4MW86_9HEMI|nr:PKD/REJ-like domain,EGF-like domain [Cinara cedri]
MHVCQTTCNDGGCEFTERGNVSKGCFCPISDSSRALKICESYRDACTNEIVRYPPCKNDGKCVTALGFPYCDCPINDSEIQCDGFDNKLDRTYPKKPSLYYRTKVKPGESLMAFLVIEPDSNSYLMQFVNNAKGTHTESIDKVSMTIDELYSECKQLGSETFQINEEMCNFAKTTYGSDHSKIESFPVIPYFMSKTRSHRTDVHFNGNKSEHRIGGLYAIQLKVIDQITKKIFFSFEFFHLVVDDESSYCLPFVDPGQNCKTRMNLLKVKRNEDMPILKMVITPDTEMCEEPPEYIIEWKVLTAEIWQNYDIDPVDNLSKKHVKLDEQSSSNPDLVIPKYILPEGEWIVHFKIAIKNQEKQYSSVANRYTCFLGVNLDGLHAEIVGSPLMQVIDSELVTIDASLSYNPNEPNSKQNYVLYIWYCDVKTDEENCQEYITTGK